MQGLLGANARRRFFFVWVLVGLAGLTAHSSAVAAIPPKPTDGIVLRMPAEGSADDTGPENTDGTLLNGTRFIPGVIGQAFDFDGVDDAISIPHDGDQNSRSAISIAMWLYSDTNSAGRRILTKQSTGFSFVSGYAIIQGSTRRLRFLLGFRSEFGTSSFTLETPQNAIILDTWQHIVCTFDGTVGRIYVDGVEKSNVTVTGTTLIVPVNDPIVLGTVPSDSLGGFNGAIDELEIYSRALSPAEVVALRDYGLAAGVTAPSGLVSMYMGEGNAVDSIGTHSATPVNGASFGLGHIGQAFLLDGVDYFAESAAAPWGFGPNATFAAWVRTNDFDADLISIAHGTVQDELLLAIVNGKARVQRSKTATSFTYRESASAVNSGQWTFVAGTMGAGSGATGLKMYVNGVEETGTASTVGAPTAIVDTTPRTLRIGWRNNEIPGAALAGSIDSLMVFNRALTSTEIANLYLATQ